MMLTSHLRSRGRRGTRRWLLATMPLVAAAVLFAVGAGTAAAAEPPTPLGTGTYADIVAGVSSPDNQVFWAAQDLHSLAKVEFSFNTTPALGNPTPVLLVIGTEPNGTQFYLPIPTTYTTSTNPPSINSPQGSVTWVPSRQAYNLVVNVPGYLTANLWFSGYPGGATLPADWDGQTSYWIQSLGAGTVNGTVTFPQALTATTVTNWGGEEETEYGTFELGPGSNPQAPPIHIGYDYAASDNPDGSQDILYAFPELDGVWRGILAHTSATGVLTECEPTVTLSNWSSQQGVDYPLTVSASCGSLSQTWTTTDAQTSVATLPEGLDGFAASDSNGSSTVPGSVALIQHVRDRGYWNVESP